MADRPTTMCVCVCCMISFALRCQWWALWTWFVITSVLHVMIWTFSTRSTSTSVHVCLSGRLGHSQMTGQENVRLQKNTEKGMNFRLKFIGKRHLEEFENHVIFFIKMWSNSTNEIEFLNGENNNLNGKCLKDF